jgi:hypothetical protein
MVGWAWDSNGSVLLEAGDVLPSWGLLNYEPRDEEPTKE